MPGSNELTSMLPNRSNNHVGAVGLCACVWLFIAPGAWGLPVMVEADDAAVRAARRDEPAVTLLAPESTSQLTGLDPMLVEMPESLADFRVDDDALMRRSGWDRRADAANLAAYFAEQRMSVAEMTGGPASLNQVLRRYVNVASSTGGRMRVAPGAGGDSAPLASVADTWLRDLVASGLSSILEPGINDRGLVSFSVFGFGEITLSMSGDRSLNISDAISVPLSSTQPQGDDDAARPINLAAAGYDGMRGGNMIEDVKQRLYGMVTDPLAAIAAISGALFWCMLLVARGMGGRSGGQGIQRMR